MSDQTGQEEASDATGKSLDIIDSLRLRSRSHPGLEELKKKQSEKHETLPLSSFKHIPPFFYQLLIKTTT